MPDAMPDMTAVTAATTQEPPALVPHFWVLIPARLHSTRLPNKPLADLGGVAGVSELEAPLVEVRGSGNESDEAQRLAAAIVRAVWAMHD